MARLKKRWWIIALIFMECIFGFAFLFTKIALRDLRLEQLMAMRFTVAALLLTLLWMFRVIKIELTFKKILRLLPVALLQPILYFIFETLGVQRTSASEAGVIIALYPVATIILSWMAGMERLSLKRGGAIMVSVIGVVIITLAGGMVGGGDLLGYVYIILAVLVAAIYTVYTRKVSSVATSTENTYVMMVTGAVGFIGYWLIRAWILGETQILWQGIGSWDVILSVLYLGILSSVVAFFIINTALVHLEPSKVTTFANITPLVALFAGVIFLHERILPIQYVGTVLVIGGVYAAVRFEIQESRMMQLDEDSSDTSLEVGIADGEAQHHEHAQVDHSVP